MLRSHNEHSQREAEILRNNTAEDFLEAAKQGNLELLNQYIAENKDNPSTINVVNDEGISALMRAVNFDHIDAVNALLAVRGIDVNAASENGTALMFAAGHGRTTMVQALLSISGIAVNATDPMGNTALMYAAQAGHADTIMALLAAPDLLINAANKFGQTALILAAGKIEAMQVLLAVPNLDINATDTNGNNVLICAASSHTALRVLLAIPSIKLSIQNKEGETASKLAEKYGYHEIASSIKTCIKKQQPAYVRAATAELLVNKGIPRDVGNLVCSFLSANNANALGKVNRAMCRAGHNAAAQIKINLDNKGEFEDKPASFSLAKL